MSRAGGGLIRDVLLQHGPPAALTDPAYIPTALAGTAVAFLLDIAPPDWSRVFLVLDAVALSVWATAGAQKTLDAGLDWLPAILLGTITAVGGGATRDLLLRRVPAVLHERPAGGGHRHGCRARRPVAGRRRVAGLGAAAWAGGAAGVGAAQAAAPRAPARRRLRRRERR